jgi:hypothetical protein
VLLTTWPMRPAQSSAVTVGTNYHETSSRYGTQVPGTAGCNNTNTCYISFNLVPAGKQLLITDISCEAFINAGSAAAVLRTQVMTYLGNNQMTDRYTFLKSTIVYEDNSSSRTFQVKDTARHLVRAGERPVVVLRSLFFATQMMGLCSIAGKIGNPPE